MPLNWRKPKQKYTLLTTYSSFIPIPCWTYCKLGTIRGRFISRFWETADLHFSILTTPQQSISQQSLHSIISSKFTFPHPNFYDYMFRCKKCKNKRHVNICWFTVGPQRKRHSTDVNALSTTKPDQSIQCSSYHTRCRNATSRTVALCINTLFSK